MIKNTIISGLLVYILSTCEGWYVEGFAKFGICVCLTIFVSILLSELERIIREAFYEIF